MSWNTWIRQLHRWLSIGFTLAVIANFAALGHEQLALWGGLSALLPLALLLLTGLTMFVLPYAAAWRRGRQTGG